MEQIGAGTNGMKRKYTMMLILALTVFTIAVISNTFLPRPMVNNFIEANVKSRSTIWERRVFGFMKDHEETFRNSTLSTEEARDLRNFTNASDVYRLKIFDSRGTIIWSTRANDIGNKGERPTVFDDLVKSGEPYYKTAMLPSSEIDNFSLHNAKIDVSANELRRVAEIYVPVIHDGEFEGVIEFYLDVTEIAQSYESLVKLALLLFTSVTTVLFFATVIAIVVSSERRVKQFKIWSKHEEKLKEEQIALMREIKLLSELNEWLQSSRSLEELFSMVSRFMTMLLPDCAGSIYVYSNSRDVLDGSCSWNGTEHQKHIKPSSCWGLRRGRTYSYGDSEISFPCDHIEDHDGTRYLCLPILAHGETVGLMHIMPRDAASEAKFVDSRQLAQMAAEQISLAIANARMRDQLHEQSIRDSLTNLYNRRHFVNGLRKHIESSAQQQKPLSLISIDVDHFKKFNDNHGHDAGDIVLRAVAAVFDQQCDRDELPCRMGGEEFMVLLPETITEVALERAEKIRKAVEKIVVRYGEKTLPRVTISLGVASYPQHGTTPQDLIKHADDALYDAKARGRNQISLGAEQSNLPSELNKTIEKMRQATTAAPSSEKAQNDKGLKGPATSAA